MARFRERSSRSWTAGGGVGVTLGVGFKMPLLVRERARRLVGKEEGGVESSSASRFWYWMVY